MLNHSKEIFKELDIPVRILECCSGDLGDLKAKSADLEAWSARKKEYFEVCSCSNLTDAQSRRLNIKAQGKDGKGHQVFKLSPHGKILMTPTGVGKGRHYVATVRGKPLATLGEIPGISQVRGPTGIERSVTPGSRSGWPSDDHLRAVPTNFLPP